MSPRRTKTVPMREQLLRPWEERDPLAQPTPEPKWNDKPDHEIKAKGPKTLDAAVPIEVNWDTVAELERVLGPLESALARMEADGRRREAAYVSQIVADLRNRVIPYASLVACTQCLGYQQEGERKGPLTCTHPWNADGVSEAEETREPEGSGQLAGHRGADATGDPGLLPLGATEG